MATKVKIQFDFAVFYFKLLLRVLLTLQQMLKKLELATNTLSRSNGTERLSLLPDWCICSPLSATASHSCRGASPAALPLPASRCRSRRRLVDPGPPRSLLAARPPPCVAPTHRCRGSSAHCLLPPTGGSYRSRERAERRGSANSGAVPELGVAGAAASSSSLAAAATSSTNCQRSAPLPRGNSGPRPVRSSVEEGARCGTCGTPKCGSLCPVVSVSKQQTRSKRMLIGPAPADQQVIPQPKSK
eukprot:XP_025000873.1 uncharacterized protein LOC112530679 [Gallus gallus]